jgi:hypothetical protein
VFRHTEASVQIQALAATMIRFVLWVNEMNISELKSSRFQQTMP